MLPAIDRRHDRYTDDQDDVTRRRQPRPLPRRQRTRRQAIRRALRTREDER